MTEVLSALNPFKRPKIEVAKPPPPASSPTQAQYGSPNAAGGFRSFISSGGATGLARKATTRKRSLIGGGGV